MKNEIIEALNADVDLSPEEYREKVIKADNVTAKHNVDGKAPVSESIRHKRVQMNFYASALNIMLTTLAAIDRNNELLAALYKEVTCGNGKQQYKS